MVLEQGLDVLPAAQSTDFPRSSVATEVEVYDDVQAACTCVSEDGTFEVRGFHFAADYQDLSCGGDGGLGDVEG